MLSGKVGKGMYSREGEAEAIMASWWQECGCVLL